MARARVLLILILSLLCVIFTDASGSGEPTHLVPAGNPAGDSGNVARSSPLPLLVLVVVIAVTVLVVMTCGCCAVTCCVLYCRYCRGREVDRSVTLTEPGIELFENPAFQFVEPESNKQGVSPNPDSPPTKRSPGFTQSSQSVVANATPRLAVNRPMSSSVFTIGNKGALQFELHVRALASPFDFSTETQSLPRMPHNQDQLQPGWPAGADGLSQTSLPPHLESTAPTSANENQETEV